MSITEQVKSEFERVAGIFRPLAEKMDADIDYARDVLIKKGGIPSGINPDHLTLRNIINLLAK